MANKWKPQVDRWSESDRDWNARSDYRQRHVNPSSPDAEPMTPVQKRSPKTIGYVAGLGEAGPYLGLGLQIAASMVLFVGGGIALDRWLGVSPWGTVVGAVLGLTGVIGLVIKLAAAAPPKGASQKSKG